MTEWTWDGEWWVWTGACVCGHHNAKGVLDKKYRADHQTRLPKNAPSQPTEAP